MGAIIPIAVLIVVTGLGGIAAFEGHLLLKAHEEIATEKVKVAERDGIIKQKEADAKLSAQLLALQTAIENRLRTVGNDTRQAISNATTDDLAAVAAVDGVRKLRAATGSGSAPTP